MLGRGLIIFVLFFSEFSCPGRVWTKFGTKIFSLFFIVPHPVLAKKIGRKWFYNFWTFFNIFLGIFLPGSSMNGIRDWNFFFFTFLAYIILILAKNIAGKRFFYFSNFLLFFSEFSCQGRVKTEFETKIFFSLSQPNSSRFGKK